MRRQKYFRFLESGFAVFLLASVFFALIALSTPVFAENLASTSASEVLQIKLDHLKETQKNDVDTLNKRIDDVLTTTGQGVDRFGVVMGGGGIFVTILLGFFGFAGYLTVTQKAKAEAQEAAENWFKENTPNLLAQLKKLEAEANDSAKSAKNSAISAEALCSAVKRKQSEIEQSNSGHPSSSTHSDDKDDEIIRLRDQELQQQPESTYSFDDWNARAHAAYASKNLTDAVYFLGRALKVEGAGATEIAKALFNKGVAQGEMGNHAGALESFAEVISRYLDEQDISLRGVVAAALVNKGREQRRAGDLVGAVACWDEVIQRYSSASDEDATLQTQVVMARVNKDAVQAQIANDTGA